MNIRSRICLSLASALLVSASYMAPAVAASYDPQALVRQADDFRQLYPNVLMQVRLTKFVGAVQDRETLLKVAVHGSEKSLIQVIEGADRGQQVLMTAEGLWVKLPRSTRAVRITPLQRMLGEASVGDIGRIRWQDDYVARLAPDTSPGRDEATVQLELTARSELAAYPRINLTVAARDGCPLEATYFLKSGKALKTVSFDKPERINNRTGIRKMVFTDLLKPENRTVLVIEQSDPKTLAPRFYALETLGEWQ